MLTHAKTLQCTIINLINMNKMYFYSKQHKNYLKKHQVHSKENQFGFNQKMVFT